MFTFDLSVKKMTEMALMVSLALVLDRLPLFTQPNGGSITLAMVPLALMILRLGPIHGFIGTALIYGFLASVLDGYLAFYPVDYLLALGSLSVLGWFNPLIQSASNRLLRAGYFTLGFALANVLRLSFHVLSGMWFFETDFLGSLTYNASYLIPSFILSLIAVLTLMEIPSIYPKKIRF